MKKYDFVRKDFVFDFEDGWLPMMENLLDEVQELVYADSDKYKNLQLVNAEELFGMLMVDFKPSTEDIERIARKYELLSIKVCERCGKKGRLRDKTGWVKALCLTHFKEWITE